MNKKIRIGVAIIAGVFGLVTIFNRVSVTPAADVINTKHHGLTKAPEVRNPPVGNSPDTIGEKSRRKNGNSGSLKADIAGILKSGQPRDEKMDQIRGLLAMLSNVDGCARTIEWLKQMVGDGGDFSVLVSGIFVESNEPLEDLFKQVDGLPPGTRSVVIAGLLQKILESGDAGKLARAALASGDKDSFNEGMGVALQLVLMQSESVDDTMKAMRSMMNGLDGESLVMFRDAYLTGLSKVSPQDAWKEVQRLGKDGSNVDAWQSGMRDKIAAQLRAKLGAAESLDFLIQQGGGASEVSRSISFWGNLNSVELNEWISDHMKALTLSQQDGVRAGVAQSSLDKGDFPAVQKQLDGIADAGVKSGLEARLWERQRETIRQEVAKNPEGTLMAIASGSEPYDAYWLEEAMGTWVAKDFDKAQEWYQKNWKSMPAEKSQYLAAAFANQAISQGDAETARQWAVHIQDTKTKQRIEAGIGKASTGNEQ